MNQVTKRQHYNDHIMKDRLLSHIFIAVESEKLDRLRLKLKRAVGFNDCSPSTIAKIAKPSSH